MSRKGIPEEIRGLFIPARYRVLACFVLVLAVPIAGFPIRSASANLQKNSSSPSVTSSFFSGTSIFVLPALLAGASLTPGTNVTVAAFINNVTKLDAWEFTLKVDTRILKPVDADVTPYWENQQARGKGQYLIQLDATKGTALVYWVSVRQASGVIPSLNTTVPFELGTATFQVQASSADTPFHIVTYDEDPHFGTILYDTSLQLIDYTPSDGVFANVRVPWDVNWDLKVNVFDLAIVGSAFGSSPGSLSWNPAADIDNSGVVDIFDLVLVGTHFGQTI